MFETGKKTTHLVFGHEARQRLYEGLDIAAKCVASTMGPSGRCVIIQQAGATPIVTKDGVTVSRSINLKEPAQKMGAELIREAASRTNDLAGDGTTTATVLTHSMVKSGLRLLDAGYDTADLKRGIERGTAAVIGKLLSDATPVTTNDEVAQVGTISANGDVSIGALIAEAMSRVGRDGVITVEDAKGMATSMDVVDGMQFQRGYLTPYFVTNQEKMHAHYDDALVLVTDRKLSVLKELVPILEAVKRSGRGLLIIADEVEQEVMQGLVLNRIHGALPVVAIKAPGFGHTKSAVLEDIAIMAGAKFFSVQTGLKLETVSLADLGKLKRVTVDAKTSTLVGHGNTKTEIEARCVELREQLTDVTLTAEEAEILRMRIAKLSAGVAVIKVGGSTELEMVERKHRVEDALNATRAAVEEGIVPGGGMSLLNASTVLDSLQWDSEGERCGLDIVRKACFSPFEQILANAGVSAEVVKMKLHEASSLPGVQHRGFNAATGEYVNMIATGIIDPVKVERVALENASSVAITFLSLDALVVDDE